MEKMESTTKVEEDESRDEDNQYQCPQDISDSMGDGVPSSCYEVSQHPRSILKSFASLRQNKVLCDVILRVDDHTIHAHRAILASSSPYFYAMFAGGLCERDKNEIELKSIDKDALTVLIDFVYTGKIQITHSNIQTILPAANLLQMKDVKQLCCDFLEQQLHTTNCLGIAEFAETHACSDWTQTARKFCAKHFEALKGTDEYLNLDANNLSILLRLDDLSVQNEETVYNALLIWVKHDPSTRLPHLHKLLDCTRLPLMMLKSLYIMMEADPYIKKDPACQIQVRDAIKYHLNPNGRLQWRVDNPTKIKPRGQMGMFCAVGGKNGLFATLRSVEVYNPKTDQWKEAAPLSCRRQECAAAVVNQCLYIIGGLKCYMRNGSRYRRHDNSMEMWCPKRNSWTTLASMSKCRSNHGVAVLDGKIYAMGGYDGQFYLRSMEVYNVETDQWKAAPAMIKSRSIFSSTVLDGKVYAIGGYGPNYLNCVERFTPESDCWEMMSPMSHPRINFGVAVLDHFIYVIGGHDGTGHLNSAEKYDAHQNNWRPIAPMTQARTGLGVAALDGYLYAAGGHSGAAYLDLVERYDPCTDTWSMTNTMINCRCNFAFTAL